MPERKGKNQVTSRVLLAVLAGAMNVAEAIDIVDDIAPSLLHPFFPAGRLVTTYIILDDPYDYGMDLLEDAAGEIFETEEEQKRREAQWVIVNKIAIVLVESPPPPPESPYEEIEIELERVSVHQVTLEGEIIFSVDFIDDHNTTYLIDTSPEEPEIIGLIYDK